MLKFRAALICACCLALLFGCAQRPPLGAGAPIVFEDSLGRTVELESAERVAVLSGSLADAWFLAGGEIAAATEDAWGIDGLELTDGTVSLGGVKAPNLEELVSAGIDFAILSATLSTQVALQPSLEALGITAAYFSVETVGEYLSMMKLFTDITGRPDLYESKAAAVEREVAEQIKRADGSAPTVLFLRAYSTGVRAKGSDSMTGAMLHDLGCQNIADGGGVPLGELSVEAIIMADPDFIFATTMGESEEAALAMLEELLTSNPAWKNLKAVKNGRYRLLPQELFQNKPNDRWGESYKILADILYGETR